MRWVEADVGVGGGRVVGHFGGEYQLVVMGRMRCVGDDGPGNDLEKGHGEMIESSVAANSKQGLVIQMGKASR